MAVRPSSWLFLRNNYFQFSSVHVCSFTKSCPTLFNPTDYSPPGSPQFSSVQSLSHVRLFATPWTAACQASLSSPTPRVYSNSCPLSRWCHPTISSSVIPFSSHLQSFPASESFQMCQFFTSGGQSIGASASASVLPMNIQDWFPLGWTSWRLLPRDAQFYSLNNTWFC